LFAGFLGCEFPEAPVRPFQFDVAELFSAADPFVDRSSASALASVVCDAVEDDPFANRWAAASVDANPTPPIGFG
jgi:hypothetical protein